MEPLADAVVEAVLPMILGAVHRAFSGETAPTPTPKKTGKFMNTTQTEDKRRAAPRPSEQVLLDALKKIAALPNNNKLRSWRGTEAVRIATEALREVGDAS